MTVTCLKGVRINTRPLTNPIEMVMGIMLVVVEEEEAGVEDVVERIGRGIIRGREDPK